MATLVKEARYILTNIENNNNKFWNVLLFDDGTCETQWGRVGEDGQIGCSARSRNQRCRYELLKNFLERGFTTPAPSIAACIASSARVNRTIAARYRTY